MKVQITSPIFYLIVSLFSFGVANTFNQSISYQSVEVEPESYSFNSAPSFYKLLSLGNYSLASSVLWIYTMMNSDIEHYQGKAYHSWLFLRLHSMTQLTPYNKDIYLYGGQYLSVIKDDIPGASLLFKKGAELFPQDFNMNYFAGLHFYLEEKDFPTALKYIDRIKTNQEAPPILQSIAARLIYLLRGDLEMAEKLIEIALSKLTPGSPLSNKFKERLDEIQQKRGALSVEKK